MSFDTSTAYSNLRLLILTLYYNHDCVIALRVSVYLLAFVKCIIQSIISNLIVHSRNAIPYKNYITLIYFLYELPDNQELF